MERALTTNANAKKVIMAPIALYLLLMVVFHLLYSAKESFAGMYPLQIAMRRP